MAGTAGLNLVLKDTESKLSGSSQTVRGGKSETKKGRTKTKM
jgi:hypothetical protein